MRRLSTRRLLRSSRICRIERMERLNLIAKSLPASQFPEPAESYICDSCGRDVTRHMHVGQAHVQQPLGPIWYTCRCGKKYISGAVEWDQLGDGERRNRICELVLFALISLPPAAIATAIVVYEVRIHNNRELHVSLGIGAAVASFFLLWLFVILVLVPGLQICASLVRTRLR